MQTDKQTKKKANSQSLLNSVRKLDKINNVSVEFTGSIEDVLADPVKWAEEQIEVIIMEHQDKYLEAKQLGEKFWNEIRDNN